MNNILKWAATWLTLLGAVLTSFQYAQYASLNIYLFNIAAILWTIWAIRIKEPSIVVVNLGMFIIYTIGTVMANYS